ncbi:MAG: hypothetical protein AAF078_09575, partial [Planctomycetota bacterium]
MLLVQQHLGELGLRVDPRAAIRRPAGVVGERRSFAVDLGGRGALGSGLPLDDAVGEGVGQIVEVVGQDRGVGGLREWVEELFGCDRGVEPEAACKDRKIARPEKVVEIGVAVRRTEPARAWDGRARKIAGSATG